MARDYWTQTRRQRLNRRRFLTGTMTAAGAAFLAACGGSEKKNEGGAVATQAPAGSPAAQGAGTPAPRGGTLTSTIVGTDAKSFHIGQTTDSASATYQGYIYGGGSLTKNHEETLETIPDAAEKWTVSDDKRTFTFTLKNVKWSDGTPLSTADYLWTYEQLKNPANKYPYVTNFDAIESYEAVDPKTLRITMKEALAVGLENSDVVTPLPKHIWEKLDWSDPVKNPEIQNPTVSNGLWKLKEWKKDNFITFVANDTYFEGRPNIDQLTVRVFGTQALAYQALKSGEVDWSSFQPSDYKEAKSLPNINVYEWYAARGSWSYIGFNFRRKALQDLNVRRAIAYATDRKGIIDGLAYGLGRPTYSVFPQSSWVYNPNVEKYDFDPKKSADLFKAAGYTLQNKKLMKDGQELKLKLLYNTGNPVREGIATVMQQQLQELGCAVDVQGLEFQSYLDAIKSEPYDYDLFVLGWNATIEPHFMKQIWTERAIPSLNSGAYVNKRVEDLFDQGGKEFDREKRKSIYGEIQRILADELPYVFLYEGLSYTGVNKKVGGIKPAKTGIGYNMHQWYITR
jgi:peptide/nickel transport system substrate-binding protein